MSGYMCVPCKNSFTGIIPYQSHMRSEKHRKKVNDLTFVLEDFTNYDLNSVCWEQEPFIYAVENGYKCTLCRASLNSVDQVKCHIRGAKHLKAKGSSALYNNPNEFSARIDQVDGNSSTLHYTGDSGFQLYDHIEEVKKLIKNMKTFKPDEEIVF